MRIRTCLLALLVVASVSNHPVFAESELDPSAEKFLACDREKGSLLKSVDSLKEEKDSLTKQKASLEKSIEQLQSQLAAKQADGDAAVAEIKEKLQAAQDEAKAAKARAVEAEGHVEKTKELHMTAQETSDLLQDQITRLYDDLTKRQEKLEEATSAHATLESELKAIRSQGDGSRRELEAQLAAATQSASSEKMALQGERDMLKVELEQLQASLREVQSAYLPVWSHPYYAYARETAEPALKYHREEIWTGKAFAKAKAVAVDLYSQGHTAARPHLQKAWVAVEPTYMKVSEQIELYWDKMQTELNKEPYKPYVDKARKASQAVYDFALGMRARAIDLWNSDEVNKAKAFVLKQKESLERDLGNLFTHALGADVPGSGIDDCCIKSMVRFTLYTLPALLIGFPLLCMRRGGKKKAPSTGIPTASPAISKTNKRMKKK